MTKFQKMILYLGLTESDFNNNPYLDIQPLKKIKEFEHNQYMLTHEFNFQKNLKFRQTFITMDLKNWYKLDDPSFEEIHENIKSY